MRNEELYQLLESLIAIPVETQWIEFKMRTGSITNEQIGEYISAMSNGATISNQAFGYLVWGVHDDNHEVKGTNLCFTSPIIRRKYNNYYTEFNLKCLGVVARVRRKGG